MKKTYTAPGVDVVGSLRQDTLLKLSNHIDICNGLAEANHTGPHTYGTGVGCSPVV